jgi:hypothetical protein
VSAGRQIYVAQAVRCVSTGLLVHTGCEMCVYRPACPHRPVRCVSTGLLVHTGLFFYISYNVGPDMSFLNTTSNFWRVQMKLVRRKHCYELSRSVVCFVYRNSMPKYYIVARAYILTYQWEYIYGIIAPTYLWTTMYLQANSVWTCLRMTVYLQANSTWTCLRMRMYLQAN